MDKFDQKPLENNCNWKNYFGDLPLIPSDRPPLTFSHSHLWVGLSSAFQDEQANIPRDTFLLRPQISQKQEREW
jgi:hypothetical protein